MSETTFDTLQVEEHDDRLVVRISRPEARNAFNLLMIDELHEVCGRLEKGPKPLLVTGSNGIFAAGADIAELRERGRDEALMGINSRLFERIGRLAQPTVAAVDGIALGGGAELAFTCDIRMASPAAVFGSPEPGLGIIAASGGCWRLTELVGKSIAKQVLLGGRNLDAAEALRLGLVAEIVDSAKLLERAHALIDRMLKWSPIALRLTKLSIDAPGGHPLVDDLAQAVLFEGNDKRERMTAFLERRSPK
jgi:enoyl-CoA hydratase